MLAAEILQISISFHGFTQRKTKFHYCIAPPAGHQEMILLALKVKNYLATMNYYWIVSKYGWHSYLGTFLHIPRAGGVWNPVSGSSTSDSQGETLSQAAHRGPASELTTEAAAPPDLKQLLTNLPEHERENEHNTDSSLWSPCEEMYVKEDICRYHK